MRGVAVVAGGLLLLGGTVLIAVADQQRVEALAEARAAVVEAEERLDAAHEVNLRLAGQPVSYTHLTLPTNREV